MVADLGVSSAEEAGGGQAGRRGGVGRTKREKVRRMVHKN